MIELPTPPTQHPNVVLICVDQWRADCMSTLGHPVVHTPHLDSLAEQGVRFDRAYSAVPSCIPARAALMTGLSQDHHRRIGYANALDWDYPTTLAGAFHDAGYQTQAIGKMHVWPVRERLGFDDVILHDGYLHFTRHRTSPLEFVDDYLPWLRNQAGATAMTDYVEDGVNSNSMVARPWDKPEHLHPTNWVVTQSLSWMYRRDPRRPFFLFLSFHRPHPPFDPPGWAYRQYLDFPRYRPAIGDWADQFAGRYTDGRHNLHAGHLRPDVLHRARAGYYGHMSHIDMQLNRLLEGLAEFGVDTTNTVFCFVSDHGEMLGEHLLFQKGLPYEGAARIPFIVAGPGITAGEVRRELVELRDVMPTLLDAAQIVAPAGLDGRSVMPMARGQHVHTWRSQLHGEHPGFGQTIQFVVHERWKYVWLSSSGHEQLFDLDADPGELRNLSGRAPAPLVDMRRRLVGELQGRADGHVQDGSLVIGRPALTTLPN